ncbi:MULTISPECIES: dTDP-glucose 4,6-dehydratase [Lysinibacillus]|uniref:dTDP-glucose 4,6-dehydratase n=1 Tax=Lysinibacillus TaxID=400634 RepID=UPI0021A4C0A0|nr:dTDP-glucose 4,6-dehydratase [Lysinibacillus capsici]MCT1539286.1 dTDP-glucose 4,6-dehydratase [Lysinibacillus capsici]MCT1570646.1 dTDP-glucose 4,6-dehydratase [Lysinibacillus capsici]MCT1647446.1 dTDP-glucose 4,6-dehydratase [Lysinibacillus capsici]MCT1726276.1 dTDP-glucose 4,6-dehydratase [Lysinibacillus capsici]MCT1783380.1 dTDP-glucose 4,6-dehydratase [Lysinibacillus capsici]
MRILVTGGAGFIGSNFVNYMVEKYPEYSIVNVDVLTYAGNLENLKQSESKPNYQFVKADIIDAETMDQIIGDGVDAIINFAAESHVDRSITNPGIFVQTNIQGTQVLLDAAKKHNVKKYLQVSTDEVYGSLGEDGFFTEQTSLAPNSPYSASKAGADHLVLAYHETFGLPVNITRCSNNYGPFHFPEKLIPLMIINALNDKKLPVYGDGKNVRDWLHVTDHCSAIDLVLHKGINGEVYNVGGHNEKTNLEVVKEILKQLDKPETLIQYVEDRLGHDRRYAIDPTKLQKELGWEPTYTFETGLKETVQWYLDNQAWWENIISGDYQSYYQQQYGGKL